MSIIRQSIPWFSVPDFRNLGVSIKILAISLLFMLVVSTLQPNHENISFIGRVLDLAFWVAPGTILSVVFLFLFGRLLAYSKRAPLWTLFIVLATFSILTPLAEENRPIYLERIGTVAILTLGLMHYFALYQKALSPALTEARLAALTARIRPHFLFNSLNAAISLVRTRPADVEMILENLADLFRAQLGDHTKSSTLEKEIELASSYIAIEQIRMGTERLKIKWKIDAPNDAQVPSLLLQPLLENAVFHGIEPLRSAGLINIRILKVKDWIYIRIINPVAQETSTRTRQGNQMALTNLSERLALMFDQDAKLTFKQEDNKYQTNIRLPYRSARAEALKAFVAQQEEKISTTDKNVGDKR